MGNYITLKGFDEFEAKIADLPADLVQEVDYAVYDAARMWEELAKSDAPVDTGNLQQTISTSPKTEEGTREVVSPSDYSAYVEWGTGTRVSVPSELAAYAITFKGIKETIGRYPKPFFFVQMPAVEKELFTQIKLILETER